ncbi:hypothetical protein QN357_11750 [Cryobacterium sp. RTC2.1]|uniref:hypothetical protein n=1 Tax=Cryobacterium sp. RTC2.1 TaxID=3048634 RepID=UPI002B22DEB2|nr:hypothetical protein [Cryobacterium sp. RTC2.1]MEB0003601.1 hypothetical protein [Cryobacterium sp. RTC2.1]
MRRWFASLGGRILLVTVGVAFVAVLVTAVVSLQLVQTLVTTQAQADLGARTTALSERPLSTLRILLKDDTLLGARGERFVLVGADGKVPETGSGALTVTQDVKSRITQVLDAGRSVSTSAECSRRPRSPGRVNAPSSASRCASTGRGTVRGTVRVRARCRVTSRS